MQSEVEKLFAEGLRLKVHCRVYRMDSQRGSSGLPRYWLTLGRDIIWDYPKDFRGRAKEYPYVSDVSAISDLLRDYIDTPVDELLSKTFKDPWSLVDILLAADRRIGNRRLQKLKGRVQTEAAQTVLASRLGRRSLEPSAGNDVAQT